MPGEIVLHLIWPDCFSCHFLSKKVIFGLILIEQECFQCLVSIMLLSCPTARWCRRRTRRSARSRRGSNLKIKRSVKNFWSIIGENSSYLVCLMAELHFGWERTQNLMSAGSSTSKSHTYVLPICGNHRLQDHNRNPGHYTTPNTWFIIHQMQFRSNSI